MALRVPESKFRDPSRDPNHPKTPIKTPWDFFLPSKSGFWPFCQFCVFLSRFQSVKTPKTSSADLLMKMASNQKIQENKLALKFNESTPHRAFLGILFSHRALSHTFQQRAPIKTDLPCKNSKFGHVSFFHLIYTERMSGPEYVHNEFGAPAVSK